MLNGLSILLLCQLVGEIMVRALHLPVPGPVAGMLVLLAALTARGRAGDGLRQASAGILRHLALLFVPASVGVVVHLHTLAQDGLAIAVALVGSTLATIAVTGVVMQALSRRRAP